METQLIERLIERISQGDEQAFRTLYDMYKGRVFNTAKMITNDEKAAEDILQDVFVIIYTKIYKLKHPEAFESWLYKIVVNRCNNYHKRDKRAVAAEDTEIEKAVGADLSETPGEVVVKKEANKELMSCINELSDKLRLCIILYYFNEMSIKEIAETVEISEGTVKSRLFKAKRALEKSLKLKESSEVNGYVYR